MTDSAKDLIAEMVQNCDKCGAELCQEHQQQIESINEVGA